MKVLELFSGTRSIGKVCDQLGWDSVSVDLILPADHQVDIMDFDYKQYDKDEFDIVWASPPCTNYSNMKKIWYGKKLKDGTIYNKELNKKDQDDADKLVLKSLEIINYFNPEYWFIENPQTGNLKNREIMKDIPFYDVDYCMYSDWGYKKRTRIWTNKKDWENKLCNGKCGNMLDNRKHKKSIGIGKKEVDAGQVSVKGGGSNRLDRYRIPEDLIFSLFLD
jgi:site-specific DNA-cytosine methylase